LASVFIGKYELTELSRHVVCIQEDRLEPCSACQYPEFCASFSDGSLCSTFSVRILVGLLFPFRVCVFSKKRPQTGR